MEEKMNAKSYRYRFGTQSVAVYPVGDNWRFAMREEDGKRKYVTRAKKADIEEAAREYFKGRVAIVWEGITDRRKEFLSKVDELVPVDDEADVLAYLRQRGSSATVKKAVERFKQGMELRGRSARHVKALAMDLDAFEKEVSGSVADVTVEALREFMSKRCESCGLVRQKQVRGTLVQFFRWCRKEGFVSSEAVTAADRLQSISVPAGARRVLSRTEIEYLRVRVRVPQPLRYNKKHTLTVCFLLLVIHYVFKFFASCSVSYSGRVVRSSL